MAYLLLLRFGLGENIMHGWPEIRRTTWLGICLLLKPMTRQA